MIAHPTARQPVIQMLLVLTLSVLVCYSFTTARAVEKEVPAKERSREGARAPEAEKPKTGASEDGPPARTREGDGGTKKPGMRDGDGGTKKPGTGDGESTRKTGARDGDGGTKKPGMRDGEGGAKKSGARDGEKPRTGEREGEGSKKPGMREGDSGTRKPGARDGESPNKTGERDGEKPRTGERDGEGGKKTGARDGEGGKKTGAGDGDKSDTSSETITLRVIKNGEAVLVGEEEVSISRLRGHLRTFLPDHAGAKVVVTGDDNIPLSALHNTVDAVRDNGNKKVGIKVD